MPRRKQNHNFQIHMDQSCLSDNMEEANMNSIQFVNDDKAKNIDELVGIVDGQLREQEEMVESSASNEIPAKDASDVEGHSMASSLLSESQHTDTDLTNTMAGAPGDYHAQEDEESFFHNDEGSILGNEHSFVDPQEPDRDLSLGMEADGNRSDLHQSDLSHGSEQELGSALDLQQEADVRDFAQDDESSFLASSNRLSNVSYRDQRNARSPRRGSGRTEALIHAAARDIVAQIEHDHGHDGEQSQPHMIDEEDEENRIHESIETDEEHGHGAEDSYVDEATSQDPENAAGPSEGGDSSSHHENELSDDVFSDHSPRSSMGSASASDNGHPQSVDHDIRNTKSPRISNISHYDREVNFVPTVRGTPRPPFRSPSSVKALQMSSPPPSIRESPRYSSRTSLPTVSRIGSPSYMAQYSPKKIPPRFKRHTPPLVLLHVTLVPLNWGWGQVLEQAQTEELSREGKTLRDSWRLLEDRMGGAILDRGILLPHPQNDYEVLEERLLEALELPMRRRARILECGHYLGPSNEHLFIDGNESDLEDDQGSETISGRASGAPQDTHWCKTCRSEIRYDSLGAGKVFRVNVYAGNGLMRASTWEACWREMERVDVEVEPIIDAKVQEELDKLASEQEKALALKEERTLGAAEHEAAQEEECFSEQEEDEIERFPELMASSPPPQIRIDSSSVYDDRRREDENRLREIYGQTPPPATSPTPSYLSPELPPRRHTPSPTSSHTNASRDGDYKVSEETTPSPSAKAFQRRQERRAAGAADAYKAASLSELLLEAGRVTFQDKKNILIAVLGIMIAVLAMRGGNQTRGAGDVLIMGGKKPAETIQYGQDVAPQYVTVNLEPEISTAEVRSLKDEATSVSSQLPEDAASTDPCTSVATGDARYVYDTVSETVRVVKTVTETTYETTISTVVVTATETVVPTVDSADRVADDNEMLITPDTLEEVEVEGEAHEVVSDTEEDLYTGEEEEGL